MGRRLRSTIPMKSSLLKPDGAYFNSEEELIKKKEMQKKNYDKGSRKLIRLKVQDTVRIRPIDG